jgi:hypothetical protein
MRITISKDAKCGNSYIPKGEYWVTLASDTQQMTLVGSGKEVKVPATRRRSKSKTRVATVTFFSSGGPIWSLVISTPQYGEWVAFLELDVSRPEQDDEKRRRRH